MWLSESFDDDSFSSSVWSKRMLLCTPSQRHPSRLANRMVGAHKHGEWGEQSYKFGPFHVSRGRRVGW